MQTRKQYYILYKVIKDEESEHVKDLRYIYEFATQRQLIEYLHCNFTAIKNMINKSLTTELKTFKEYCIIKESERE